MRQTDPGRGQSLWKRGVRRYSQILICPGCQDTGDWMADLDRCSQCASVHLVKRLGEVECRDCGAIVSPEPLAEAAHHEAPGEEPAAGGMAVAGSAAADRSSDLSEEVARALDRVLGRSLVSQSIQRGPDPEARAGGAGHRQARASAEHHAAAHPGSERQRAARPGVARSGMDGLDAVGPEVVRTGAFAG